LLASGSVSGEELTNAKNKDELIMAQAMICAELRLHPATDADSDAEAFWAKTLKGVPLKAEEGRVVFGEPSDDKKAKKAKKLGSFYVPPPILFEIGAAVAFALRDREEVTFTSERKGEKWTVTLGKGKGTHRFHAAALVQAALTA
jgi:hypothetical protein